MSINCSECGGSGVIVLLTSSKPCEACGGVGAPLDLALIDKWFGDKVAMLNAKRFQKMMKEEFAERATRVAAALDVPLDLLGKPDPRLTGECGDWAKADVAKAFAVPVDALDVRTLSIPFDKVSLCELWGKTCGGLEGLHKALCLSPEIKIVAVSKQSEDRITVTIAAAQASAPGNTGWACRLRLAGIVSHFWVDHPFADEAALREYVVKSFPGSEFVGGEPAPFPPMGQPKGSA